MYSFNVLERILSRGNKEAVCPSGPIPRIVMFILHGNAILVQILDVHPIGIDNIRVLPHPFCSANVGIRIINMDTPLINKIDVPIAVIMLDWM